ncbi:MAG: hypothetical protein AAB638_04255 [Patescibacteria group bacterium]
MFRSIQQRIIKRVDSLKKKTQAQLEIEKCIRRFLIGEFGSIGETLSFDVSYENKKLHLQMQNKTATNEIIIRSSKLAEACKAQGFGIQTISVN